VRWALPFPRTGCVLERTSKDSSRIEPGFLAGLGAPHLLGDLVESSAERGDRVASRSLRQGLMVGDVSHQTC
jgi:hypothetical protein